jgi:hypothetical protein
MSEIFPPFEEMFFLTFNVAELVEASLLAVNPASCRSEILCFLTFLLTAVPIV